MMESILLSHPGGGITWVLMIVVVVFGGFALLIFAAKISKKLGRRRG